MDPLIVEKPEILLVGIPYFGDPAGGEFAQTWERFVEHEKAISNRVNPNEFFGLEFYTADMQKSHRWYYLASVEVANLDEIPLPLVAKRLPACTYAVFTVQGGLAKLGETFGYAYGTWLPGSNYQVAHPFDFEFYEEDRFKGGEVADSELEIYIPVKPKE
jgi:AraC family transcriptional regulator